MRNLLFLLLTCQVASPAIHSLKHVYTACNNVPSFPDFVAVVFVDGVPTEYYDSITKTTSPKQDWMKHMMADTPKYWEEQTWYWEGQEQIGRVNIATLKEHFNKSEGINFIQVLNGCEWDDETGAISGFGAISYNAEDLLILDMDAQRWIAMKPQLLITQHKWNNDKGWLEFMERRLLQECPIRLQRTLEYGKDTLQRTKLPLLSLLQRSPSSPVTCHATGFYPDGAVMFWSRDGEQLHEHDNLGELLFNHDNTFQLSVDLDVTAIKSEDWQRYGCVFQISGVPDDIITRLDPKVIKTNWVRPIDQSALIAVAVFLVAAVSAATGITVYMKRKAKDDSPDAAGPGNSVELTQHLNPET